MLKLSRRVFFKRTTASVATLGVLAAAPVLVTATEDPEVAATDLSDAAAPTETLIAHVRDFTTGEVSLMVGTQEIIYRDPDLVLRLLRAVQ